MASVTDPEFWDLRYLTPAEELWIWRMRWRTRSDRSRGRIGAAASLAEAADMLGITETQYWKLETGKADAVDLLHEIGAPNPTIGELCRLARRRSKSSVREVEEALGISRPVLHAAEGHGQKATEPFAQEVRQRLVAWWEEQGFRFP